MARLSLRDFLSTPLRMPNDASASTFLRLTSRAGGVRARLCSALPASAQAACRSSKDSTEATRLASFATLIAFSPGGLVRSLPAKRVRIAFEASYVTSPSRDIQQPDACDGIK